MDADSFRTTSSNAPNSSDYDYRYWETIMRCTYMLILIVILGRPKYRYVWSHFIASSSFLFVSDLCGTQRLTDIIIMIDLITLLHYCNYIVWKKPAR